jgi:hypothetical protein
MDLDPMDKWGRSPLPDTHPSKEFEGNIHAVGCALPITPTKAALHMRALRVR